ncbi:ferrochelatase [Eggerthellaceae bacterium zg-893]|nr:ferrochelatase [Eggerthellaceae bacterium zg-893]
MTEKRQPRCGVVLVNTGSPAAPVPEAVRDYLSRFLSDPRIAPKTPAWPFILKSFILPRRSKASAARYASIWTEAGSPLAVAHAAIERKLQERFDAAGDAVVVKTAYSYSKPFFEDALRELAALGVGKIVVLPLFPQTAFSQAAGTVVDAVDAACAQSAWDGELVFIDGYGDDPGYIAALVDAIRAAGFDPAPESGHRLFLSYHSIPLADVEAGDDYPDQVARTNALLADELGIGADRWRAGFQSRFDKERSWVSPFSADVLERFACEDGGTLFFVCPNFAVDCLETLYDIPNELEPAYRRALREAGRNDAGDVFVYVPCLNDSPAHIDVLFNLLKRHL